IEVEVKVRLPDSTSHQKLSTLLSPFYNKTLLQEKVFFNGSDSQLSSNLAVLRLCFITTTATTANHCVLSLKAKPVISQGINCAQELEEPMGPTLGHACIAEPWQLLSITDSAIVERVKLEFGVSGLVWLVCLGGFRNLNT
ncbi:triphosphate tunel metalloenzyme 3, partial [Quercus suber]